MKEYQSLSHTRWDCKYPSESRLKFFFACRHRRENQLVRFSMRPPNESHCSEALGKLGFRKQCDLDQTAGQKFPRFPLEISLRLMKVYSIIEPAMG